jgi:hypothetical protein
MVELAQNYHELEKCTEDILSVIKPTEEDRNKRLHAIQELVNSIYLVSSLRGNFLLFGYHMALFHYLERTTCDPKYLIYLSRMQCHDVIV